MKKKITEGAKEIEVSGEDKTRREGNKDGK